MRNGATLVVGSLLFLLGGCGAPAGEPDENSNIPVPENAVPTETAATDDKDWNASNACSLLDNSAVAEAAGSEVTEAKLTGVVRKEGLAAVSTCIYTLANNSTITVLTRRSPVPDYSDYSVEQARTLEGRIAKSEDVEGIGRAALWSHQLNSLQIFIDDTRYLTISIMNPQGSDSKKIATAIGAKLAA